MKSITCKSDRNLTVTFTYNHDTTEYFLVSADGIYSVKNKISSSPNATTDGATYNGSGVESRNIVITVNMIRNYRSNRDYLSRVFRTDTEGILIHEDKGEQREIRYRVESLDVEETGVLRQAVISLVCFDPYFTDGREITVEMAKWHPDWEFPGEIPENGMEFGHKEVDTIKQVENMSAKNVGLLITLEAGGQVVNPILYNQTTDETLKLLCTMEAGDKILLNTNEGIMTVKLIRNSVETDYDYVVDEDNSDYIQLVVGHNVVKYDADEGVDFLEVTFRYANKYLFA